MKRANFSNAEFIAGASEISQIPNINASEVAFVGRSNVGKSSLINGIVGRKSLARVSQNPGCTKQINFFRILDDLVLADLPGYGFAKISHADRKKWDHLIGHYLQHRTQLRRVFVLVDSRHEIKPLDLEMLSFLNEVGLTCQVVLTKIDKAKDIEKRTIEIKFEIAKFRTCLDHIILTSSTNKTGLDELVKEIINIK